MEGIFEHVMIKQFLTLVVNNLLCVLGDTVDSAFANNLNLGVICIAAIIGQLKMLTRSFVRYAEYYYRLKCDRTRAGMYLSFLFPGIVSVTIIAMSKQVWHLFYIEEQYRDLLSSCLIASFIGFPFENLECYVRNFCVYSNKETIVVRCNVLFYIALTALDFVSVVMFHSAILLFASTSLCHVVYAIGITAVSGVCKDKYKKGDIISIIVEGASYAYSRFLASISVVVINAVGTRLGTEQYALLAISRQVLGMGQDCLHPIEPVCVTRFRNRVHKLVDIVKETKFVIVTGAIVFFFASTIPIFFIHGDLPLVDTFVKCLIINTMSCVVYITYVVLSGEIIVTGNNKALRVTNNYRFATTVLLCICALRFNSCVPLLFYSFVTDSVVTLVAYKQVKSFNKPN